jgi:hypothetical protein
VQGKTRPGLRLTILVKALLIRMPAVLVGCRAPETAIVSGLHQVVGTDLLGARGLTDGDQRRIDQTARSDSVPAAYTAQRNARCIVALQTRSTCWPSSIRSQRRIMMFSGAMIEGSSKQTSTEE